MSDNRLGDLFIECPLGEDWAGAGVGGAVDTKEKEVTVNCSLPRCLQSSEGGYGKCMKKTLEECGKKISKFP